nr:probable UDP-3-O-acylglucosamine N-acyltransferase 2, mitochondrial [Tanacetum cinerariifolium]
MFHKSATIDPTALIDFGAVVHSGSLVAGNVRVGSGTVVGPNVTIGQSTKIGYNVALANCTIGRRGEEVQTFIKNSHSGKTITLEAETSDTIGNMKANIYEKEGFSTYRQNLFSAGMQLDDSHTLADYNIKKEGFLKWKVLTPSVR